MRLSLSFARALMPCILTGLGALNPVTAAEPAALPEQPAVVAIAESHTLPNAQISYAEWRKRLEQARVEMVMQTHEQVALNGQAVLSAPKLQ